MATTTAESRDSIAYDADADVAAAVDDEWWKHAVIYQIYPRSFMDSNDDGVGDLKGITAQLTHLSDMGITATWLSPIFASPMVDFGYDISNFTAIQPEYGTMHDFERFVAEANQLGIKVILDFVPNHTSDRCEWFMKSAARVEGYADFYVWSDGRVDSTGARQPPNNWQSVFYGPAWTWHEQRQQFYLHQFTSAQPDLNYRNPRVAATMDSVLRFWLDKGVSGFRVDAVNHLFEAKHLHDEPLSGRTSDKHSYDYTEHIHTKDLPETYELLQHWRQLLDVYTAQHGGHARILMTEAYADLKAIMDYYEDARGVHGAHLPFNFLLIEDVKADRNGRVDARDLVMGVQKWLTYMPRGYVANWVLGNHDKPRTASRLGAELVDALHMLLLTLPGVAITYNGEEIGMEDYRDIPWEQTVDPPALNVGPERYKDVSRDPVRTPFQWSAATNAGFSKAPSTWLPVHPNYKHLNLADQKARTNSHYHIYKQLVELRQMPTLRHGHTTIEAYNRNVLVLKRALLNEPTVLTIINVDSEAQAINLLNLLLPSLPSAIDKSHLTVTPLVTGVNANYAKGSRIPITNLMLPPHQGLVCALND